MLMQESLTIRRRRGRGGLSLPETFRPEEVIDGGLEGDIGRLQSISCLVD